MGLRKNKVLILVFFFGYLDDHYVCVFAAIVLVFLLLLLVLSFFGFLRFWIWNVDLKAQTVRETNLNFCLVSSTNQLNAFFGMKIGVETNSKRKRKEGLSVDSPL